MPSATLTDLPTTDLYAALHAADQDIALAAQDDDPHAEADAADRAAEVAGVLVDRENTLIADRRYAAWQRRAAHARRRAAGR